MEILLSNFEDLVPPKIYFRGKDYYYDDAVFDLREETPGEWVAHVHGTEDYRAEIDLKGKQLESWYCDCPYDGGICKHVVAAVLAIREQLNAVKCLRLAGETDWQEEGREYEGDEEFLQSEEY